MTEKLKAEAEVGADLAPDYVAELRKIQEVGGVPFVYERGTTGDLTVTSLGHLLPHELSTKGLFVADTLDDFVAYVDDHGTPATSIVYIKATDSGFGAHAVIDAWHEGKPGRRNHQVSFVPAHSEQWRYWMARCGKKLGQRELAEILEDRAHDIVEPPAADLREIVLTFRATRKVKVTNLIHEDTTDITFGWETETTGGGKNKTGDVTLPTELVVAIPPYRGMEPQRLTLKLAFGVDDEGLSFSMRAPERCRILEDIQEAMVNEIRDRLDESAPVYLGEWRA